MSASELNTDFLRVPYYVEGNNSKTFFLPACRNKKGYTVGPKGNEETFVNYWAALGRLLELRPPRFRRPNSQGNFGIVTCGADDFEEVSRSFLDAELKKYDG